MNKFDTIYAVLLIAILLCILFHSRLSVKDKPVPKTIANIAANAGIGVTVVFAFLVCTEFVAKNHGATDQMLNKMPIHQIVNTICSSHSQSKNIPEDLSNSYILYYKFSCPDCRATYHDFQDYLKQNPLPGDLYYVPSSSDIGKDLLNKYGATYVPSLVYVYPNGRTFATERLYDETEGGPVFRPEAVDKILSISREVRASGT